MYTIRDVAKLSGVSRSTVSRVLNNHPYVSDEKRKRVEEVMKQLHFTPNQISNHFRLKRTGSIGIIIPYLSHPYFAELAGVLSEESHNYGYKPVLFQTFGDRHQEIDVFEKWKRKELDALIITSSSLNQVELDEMSMNGILVICNEAYKSSKVDVFCLNEKHAAYKSVVYLIKKGRRKIAFCSDYLASPSQQERLLGYKLAHQEHKLTWDEHLIFDKIASIHDGYMLGKKLHQTNDIDAIFAGSDFVAAGYLKAAHECGLSVPNELSIIGFDNHSISDVTSPAITTMTNQVQEMAKDLVHALELRLSGQSKPFERKHYESKLLIKGSA
ncbi:LacI family DNA-binding transcriptional regulator [Shouchella miscanthi]|uniref:LacI family DNA-binding transcriptional regulator n=1 Tax=Shouchella miscanthi TaxID=2598861 RepID=A0ABU6NKN5_9BACI|nr:LacI family DNA-binding transcriptional regulator [Shouchella miscanthi]